MLSHGDGDAYNPRVPNECFDEDKVGYSICPTPPLCLNSSEPMAKRRKVYMLSYQGLGRHVTAFEKKKKTASSGGGSLIFIFLIRASR